MENEVISVNLQRWNAIRPKHPMWIEENVKEADQHVKEMLQLIEQNGDMSVEDVKPALISHVKESFLRHQLLADHYAELTNAFENFEETFVVSQKNTSLLTPNAKQGVHTVQGQVVNSHTSPSSNGGISDASSNAYSGSSSFSSDSDSESFNSSPVERPDQGKHKTHDAIRIEESEDYEMLMRRIKGYENELKVSTEKLQFAEKEIAKLKSQLQNNEAVFSKMSSLEAQVASAENKIQSYEAHIDTENKKTLLLQEEINKLGEKLELEKIQAVELQESIKKYRTELSVCDLEVKKLSEELQDTVGSFSLEKWELESCISKLTGRLTFHVAKNEELQIQFESLVDELKKCEDGKVEMERQKEFLEKDVENAKAEVSKKNELVDTLNQNLDGQKLKHDMLTAEKDEVSAKLQAITAELSSRDNRIRLLVKNTFELQSEKIKLNTIYENSENEKAQLKLRIEELEMELGAQSVVISERAEEKREAIRQLCYSIDHFRSAYEELRTTYVLKKRPTAVV